MKKKMLSTLLVLVLFLSIAPITAFGVPRVTMTLTQQTTGEFSDLDKEFVYYIPLLNYDIYFGYVVDTFTQQVFIDTEIYSNVEVVEDQIERCRAGDVNIFARRSNYDELNVLYTHQVLTGHNIIRFPCSFYKITLKSGESVEMRVETGTPLILLADLEDNYSLSCIAGDKETPFPKDHPGENGIVSLTFEPKDGGTITLKQTNGKESEDTTTNGTSFPDVPSNSEYATAIEYVNKKGVMVGDDQGKFNPDNIVNRAEMATIVCRVLEQTENLSKSNVFNDVPVEHWANVYIGKASELGIVNGYGDGRFGPSDPVTCEQAVTMIVRAIGEGDKASSYGGYPDGYIRVAQEKNLLEGILVAQGQGMSRGAVAVLLYNYYTTLNNPSTSEDGHTHNWATRHIEEVGHNEVVYVQSQWKFRCNCGFTLYADDRYDESVLDEIGWHMFENKHGNYWVGRETDPSVVYIVDVPAHDETYCTICGAIE